MYLLRLIEFNRNRLRVPKEDDCAPTRRISSDMQDLLSL